MHTPDTVSNKPLYDAQISAVLPPVRCTVATAAAVVAIVAVVVVQGTAAAVAAGDRCQAVAASVVLARGVQR
jgi:hypothetical protein